MAVLKLTKDNFDAEALNSELPVLVDFWAEWCGPCRMFSPIVDEFAEENQGKVKVGKVNVDEEPDLAGRYGVMSIPTAILFKNGEIASTLVGLQQKESLEEYLEKQAQIKKQRQKMVNEEIAKMEREKFRLSQSWNNERQMAKAIDAYRANAMTEMIVGGGSPLTE